MDRFEQYREVGYGIKTAQHTIQLRMDDALRPLGLTTAQYVVMNKLVIFPGISNAELARKSFVTAQNMNILIGGLKKAGLLQSEDHETHGRIQKITLTKQGKALLAKAHRIIRKIEDSIFVSFTGEELELFSVYLGKIANQNAKSSVNADSVP